VGWVRRLPPGLPARLAAVVLMILAAVAVALALRAGTDPVEVPRAQVPAPPAVRADDDVEPFTDPFAYDPGERGAFERRAAAGTSHPIYKFSPGGAQASAARTARWRPVIERAAKAAGVSADRLEGLVLLESAGRPDAVAGGNIQGAAGLTQILAETGQNLLGSRWTSPPASGSRGGSRASAGAAAPSASSASSASGPASTSASTRTARWPPRRAT
jgi:hypothetical protein